MADVAAVAGVGLKTVSRVVNQETGVSAATLARVESAIASLDYRRNEIARSLLPGQASGSIGLVIGNISNPCNAMIARAVEQVAESHGQLLITVSSEDDSAREEKVVRVLTSRRIDGLIVVPAGRDGDQSHLEAERRLGTPIVCIYRPPRKLECDTILIDNVGGVRMAVEHLIAHGHRRIGMVADGLTFSSLPERLLGYRLALDSAGIGFDEELVQLSGQEPRDAAAATDALLSITRPPTAILAANNRMTVGVLRTLRARGLERVAVVGFDDVELGELMATPLTVVAYDTEQIGVLAASCLFDRLAGDDSPPKHHVLPTHLVPRGSGEIRP